jgi:hypothetical protein
MSSQMNLLADLKTYTVGVTDADHLVDPRTFRDDLGGVRDAVP